MIIPRAVDSILLTHESERLGSCCERGRIQTGVWWPTHASAAWKPKNSGFRGNHTHKKATDTAPTEKTRKRKQYVVIRKCNLESGSEYYHEEGD